MGQQVFEYTSSQTRIRMPANATHVQAYINGGGAPGQNGANALNQGGDGGGGGAFCSYDIDTTPASVYSVVIGGPQQQSRFEHVKDDQLTTGQSYAYAGGASGKTGAQASSCGKGGYDAANGVLDNIHKGGDGAGKQDEEGGGGGGGGRVVVDGGNGLGCYGSGLGGGNGGMISEGTPNGSPGMANTGGGGGGGRKDGTGGQGAGGKIRLTITTNP